MIELRLALKEIKNNKKFVLFFIINMAIGLVGLITLEWFKVSFDQVLSAKSKSLLGADVSIGSRREITQKELDQFKAKARPIESAQVKSLFSMGMGKGVSRLVDVKSIPNNYPFYGTIILKEAGPYKPKSSKFLSEKEVWVYPEVLVQLKVEIGDEISIGQAKFLIKDVVVQDAQQTIQMTSIAPRIYMSPEGLARSQLIKKGSTVFYGHYLLLGDNSPSAKEIKEHFKSTFDDPKVKVYTPKDSSERMGRVIKYLGDFLGLVSLSALFLANISLFYLYRSYLHENFREMAILACLGLPPRKVFFKYILHVLILGFIGTTVSVLVASFFLPLVLTLAKENLPFAVDLGVKVWPIILAYSMGLLGTILLAFPLLAPILKRSPQEIFLEASDIDSKITLRQLAYAIPWFIFFSFLAFNLANSYVTGGIFVATLIGVTFLVYPLGNYFLSILRNRSLSNLTLHARLAVKYLSRTKISTLSSIMALGVASLLINLIPTLESSVSKELDTDGKNKRPSLFLFDIQEEQTEKLQSFLQSNGTDLIALSPMVRSKITKVNGEKFVRELKEVKTREDQQEHRARNRGINLSYRDGLSTGEKIIKGRPFSGRYDESSGKPIELSVERRYARRLDIDVGDKVEFDILGIPISTQVVNIRKVKWTSFLPNFFMLVQPGAIEDAPKTFLAAVPQISTSQKNQLMVDLFEGFSNISMVDITRAIKRIVTIIQQMGQALKFMSLLTILVGLVVLYSLARHQVQSRVKEMNLLKMIGMNGSKIKKMLIVEFSLIGFAASSLGIVISLGMSYALTQFALDMEWIINYPIIILSIPVITFLCATTAYLASGPVLRSSPQVLLQEH